MNVLTLKPTPITHDIPAYDDDLKAVHAAKDRWAITPINERIKLLKQVKKDLMDVAEDWVLAAGRNKQIKPGSPLLGEEWISGPYAVMSGCNGLIATLSAMKEKKFLNPPKKRNLSNDQMAVQVLPHSIWDRLLLSGVYAEIWMKKGVNKKNLKNHAASAYDVPEYQRTGKVALILGAGNIAAITPLDAFQKLFLENQVVIIKMNPVNEYLTPYLRKALSPLIAIDAVRIVQGNGDAGAYLCEHDLIDEIHITGARSTHDKIVWGIDSEAHLNKRDRKSTRLNSSH